MASPYAYAYDLVTILIAVLWLARDGLNRSEVVAIVVAGVLVFAAPLGAGPTGLLGATIVLAAALRRYMLPARLSSALSRMGRVDWSGYREWNRACADDDNAALRRYRRANHRMPNHGQYLRCRHCGHRLDRCVRLIDASWQVIDSPLLAGQLKFAGNQSGRCI